MSVLVAAPRLVQPAYAHIPEAAYTDGDQVSALAEEAHFAPMPEQRLCVDAIFAKNNRGQSVASETWVIACRQNLKTGVEKIATLGWAFLFKEDPIIWTAHEWDPTIKEAFNDLDELISGYRWLARQVRWVHRGDRQQEIALRNGSRIKFKTRTKGGGRGLAGAKVILDEGWALKPEHTGALYPTMAARSITGDPQILGGSSAAHADSVVLHDIVERGRAAATNPVVAAAERSLVYIEYCAPPPEVACDLGTRCDHGRDTPGCGCDKEEHIRAGNPATDRLISLDHIRGERRRLLPSEYCLERMGWHEIPPGKAKVIPLADWVGAQDGGSEPVGAVMASVVYANDKRSAAIGLAGRRSDGRWHVEVADEVRPSQVGYRVREVIARSRQTTHPVVTPVAVDPHAFEGECITDLEGLLTWTMAKAPPELAGDWPERVAVRKLTATDVAASFSGFYTSLTDAHDLRHRGQDALTVALVGATSRQVGDAGEAWGRRRSGVDIKCLVAVSQARWLHEQENPVAEVQPGAWAL